MRTGLRSVALFEAAKGLLVLLAGGGVLLLVGRDAQFAAERLIVYLHLDPARGYPRVFLDVAARLTDGRLLLLAAGALIYAGVRFTEAYGLWRGYRWAEWVAVVGAALYLPFDFYELSRQLSLLTVAIVVTNLAIIAYVGRVLVTDRRPGGGAPRSPTEVSVSGSPRPGG